MHRSAPFLSQLSLREQHGGMMSDRTKQVSIVCPVWLCVKLATQRDKSDQPVSGPDGHTQDRSRRFPERIRHSVDVRPVL